MRTLWDSISLALYVANLAATVDAKNIKPNTIRQRIANMILTLKEWRGKKLYTTLNIKSMLSLFVTPPSHATYAVSPSSLVIASRQTTSNPVTQTVNSSQPTGYATHGEGTSHYPNPTSHKQTHPPRHAIPINGTTNK